MGTLPISWRELAAPVVLFIALIAFFGILAALTGWPNATDGWSIAVAVAAIIAFAPHIARGIAFLQQSRASIEGPFGLKLNFASAVERSETKVTSLAVGAVQQGTLLLESGISELEQAAIEANRHNELVIDVEDGSAWYLTRLFAVAATADLLGSPRLLILVGQKGGQSRQAGGSIAPADLVKAVTQKDARYAKVLRHAQGYMRHLRAARVSPPPGPPLNYPNFLRYDPLYEQVGEPVFMRILVEQLITPDPGVLNPADQWLEVQPPWVTLADLQQRLSPWLGTDFVDVTTPPKQQIAAILNAKGNIALAVRNGTFEGIIDVERAARHILGQLVERTAA